MTYVSENFVGCGKFPISSEYLEALALFSAEQGLAAHSLLSQTGIPGNLLLETKPFAVGNHSISQVIDNLRRETKDPLVAVKFGKSLSRHRLGPVGIASRSAPTLREAFEVISRYLYTFSGYSQSLSVTEFDDHTDYRIQAMDLTVDEELRSFFALSSILCWAWCGRRYTNTTNGRIFETAKICHAAPSAPVPKELLPPGLALSFNEPANILQCPNDYLDSRIDASSKIMHEAAICECDRQLSKLQKDVGTSARVRSVLRVFKPFLPTAEIVAQRLGISVATMKRRLAAEGNTFQEIKDNERFTLISTMLLQSSMTVDEIAKQASFSDGSALTKAFRHRFGVTPGQYREHHTGSDID
jgi:AraC-like DNA-binding protein